MGWFSGLAGNLDLMKRMWEKTGHSWQVTGAAVSENALKSAMVRCVGCQSVGECRTWLDGEGMADAAPSFCANHDFLNSLDRT